MSQHVRLSVPSTSAGERLDTWLASQSPVGSRTQAARLIEYNRVKVSGVAQLKVKASYRLRGEEVVEVEIPDPSPSSLVAQNIPIEILHQDYDIVVVNKPAGLVTHPAAGHREGTLVNALLYHVKDLSDIGGVERPGLVHRLDKETSGVLVVAKNNKSHLFLSDLFRSHNIDRVYWAIVAGVPKEKKKTIVSRLARHPVHRKVYSSQATGKEAITHYEVIQTFGKQMSLLKITLETGRTHQIRVHLSEQGNPVMGDKLYGVKRQLALLSPSNKKLCQSLTRQALHAAELGFEHPRTRADLKFETGWPQEIKDFIAKINS